GEEACAFHQPPAPPCLLVFELPHRFLDPRVVVLIARRRSAMASSGAHLVTSRTKGNAASIRTRNAFLSAFQSTGFPSALRRWYSASAQFQAKRATPAARRKAASCSGVGFSRILWAF